MKILERNVSYYHNWVHGYFLAKKYFRGAFIRKIEGTLFDIKTKRGTYAYIYVTTKNALIFAIDYMDSDTILLELEPTDNIELPSDGNKYLTTAMNSVPGMETTMSAETTTPIHALLIDDQHLFFAGIVPDIKYGELVKLNLKTVYLTEKNYNDKIAALAEALHSPDKAIGKNLPGLSPQWVMVNLYAVIVITMLIPLFFIYMIITDPRNRLFYIIPALVIFFPIISNGKRKR
jgi:hypothetical protein